MPRHLGLIESQVTHHIISWAIDVPDPEVAEVSPFPESLGGGVEEAVVLSVPSPVTDIEPSNKGHLLIDQDYLFVVTPEEGDH